MNRTSVILLGGPDSGKTNYIGRLWPSFRKRIGRLRAESLPQDIRYVDGAVEHLMQGSFAPRSDRNLEEGRQDFRIPVRGDYGAGDLANLLVPDISGELWTRAVETSELPEEWMSALKEAAGAVLFVRAHSDQNVAPLDWVTARSILRLDIEAPDGAAAASGDNLNATAVESAQPPTVRQVQEAEVASGVSSELPTQVVLCELMRYLDLLLSERADGGRPRVAVVIAAWDLLDEHISAAGPMAFLRREFPLLAGRLAERGRLDVAVFGLSIVGGDLDEDDEFKRTYFEEDITQRGWVVVQEDSSVRHDQDVTLPLAWAVGA